MGVATVVAYERPALFDARLARRNTGQLLLDHKGISYKRTDLLPVVSWVVLKALRFPDVTVPAAKIDGERVQGTRAIARELERRRPEPPLFPGDAVG